MKPKTPDIAAADQAAADITPPLPTQGGVYHFDPSTKAMRQVEGVPAEASAPQATTGEGA